MLSPDEAAKVENIVYNDGTAFSGSQNGKFALCLLHTFYSETGKEGDIRVTDDAIMQDGSERLSWSSRGGGYSGVSFFEVRGTDRATFLMFTIYWLDEAESQYLDTVNGIIASYVFRRSDCQSDLLEAGDSPVSFYATMILMATLDLRPSSIAGKWYDGDPGSLARSVDDFLNRAKNPDLDGDVIGVIAPHAGHLYSGAVAGHAFAALRGRTFDLVAVISPMHHQYIQPLITTSHQAYITPLGLVPVDREALTELDVVLKSELNFGLSPVPHDPEHSLEIELPFLQRALSGEWKLLPVMVRAQDPFVSDGLGKALAKVLRGKNSILVASTDLSHFYDQQSALSFDRAMLHEIESFSPEGVFAAERTGTGFACGHAAVAAVLWAALELGADTVKILHHATSGDVTGDYSSVVGYGAAAILKSNS